MRPTLSLIKREFAAYFLSPIAYVVLAVFLLVTGHLFYLTLNLLTETGPRGVEFPMQTMLGDEKFWLVFLFIPPLLTMRLFAEERGAGTLEMLMTAPIRDWQVVLAKFVACFLFYLVLWLPTLLYWPVLTDFRGITLDWKFTNTSKPLLIAITACAAIFFVNLMPASGSVRLTCLALLTLLPTAVYLWLYDVDMVPNFAKFPPEEKAMLAGVQAGMFLLIFTAAFLFPLGVARAGGASMDTSAQIVGWLQFALAVIFVLVHLTRTHSEGIFRVETQIDPRPVAVSYLGVVLAGAMSSCRWGCS